MNSAFNATINIGTNSTSLKEGIKLAYFNLIDVGVITNVHGSRCSVESFKVTSGSAIIYDEIELVYPGGAGSVSPEGMTCIVLFPAEVTDLEDKTISLLEPFFSSFGGKAIPISTGVPDVCVGPDFDGTYKINSDGVDFVVGKDFFTLSVDGMFYLSQTKDKIEARLLGGTVWLEVDKVTNSEMKMYLSGDTPYLFIKNTPTEHWSGHIGRKPIADVKYDMSQYTQEDFMFASVYTDTGHTLYVYKSDGTELAHITAGDTGDIHVDRNGTKLDIVDGKVVITGDLEVSGKTTITGMSTDIQNFLNVLMSGLVPMYTLGSPATHKPDGNYIRKMNEAQGYL